MGSSSSKQPDCCPPGSLPATTGADAGATEPPRGEEISLDANTIAYVVRPKEGEPIKGSIIVFHDIWGHRSGRTLQVADELSSWGNYIVIVPDFFQKSLAGIDSPYDVLSFRGFFTGKIGTTVSRMRKPWESIEDILFKLVLPWVNNNGGKDAKIALLGYCWGAWAALRSSALTTQPGSVVPTRFACAIGAHPSFQVQKMQRTGPKAHEILGQLKVPMLLLTSKDEPKSILPDGEDFKEILKASPQSNCVPFPEMFHGWVIRADIRDEKQKKEVDRALKEMKDFLTIHM